MSVDPSVIRRGTGGSLTASGATLAIVTPTRKAIAFIVAATIAAIFFLSLILLGLMTMLLR
ncbi:MAG: hypothetical protein EPO26_06950 [Chloroflexota bacterium]|nr:MAG: hypothetical protein EPO26_06950 [Chloroflexota bacterium]